MATSSHPLMRRKKAAANLFRITMNKFLKKKAPEPLDLPSNDETVNAFLTGSAPPPPTSPLPPTPTLKKSASRWKKNKRPAEPRPDINLEFALPSNDDFRTSLFMPALTARFSMLREQDDPNSILGKASDDSVLQPRRRSRMGFGVARSGLDDIAEVSSLRSTHSSVRPPFADRRLDSVVSEENSEDGSSRHGSVMSRSRPGEGNSMFGGRQKVYMIPKTGTSSMGSTGRSLYDDDVGPSSFQKPKRERDVDEIPPSTENHGFDFGLDQTERGGEEGQDEAIPTGSSKKLSHSPSLSSSENKWSTHSTHSETAQSEGRSSTAATSVASQPPTTTTSPVKAVSQPSPVMAIAAPSVQPLKRADTKIRRLYEQGLDQHIQEQQTSALSRLNSIHRQHTLTSKHPPLYLHSVKSASNLNEQARQPVYALSERDAPNTAPLQAPSGAFGLATMGGANPIPSAPCSPLPPQYGMDLDENNALTQALQPGDRGKATAMGAFNKPKQSFDEQQYLERQRQLQRSVSSAATKKGAAARSATTRNPGSRSEDPKASDESRLRSQSASKVNEPSKAYNVFQSAVQRMDSQPGAENFDKSALPDTHRPVGSISPTKNDERNSQQSNQPILKTPDFGYGTQQGKWQPRVLPSVLEHPALRPRTSNVSMAQEDNVGQLKVEQSIDRLSQTQLEPPKRQTLRVEEPAAALRRSHLVLHLRQRSDGSSITQVTDRTSTFEAPEFSELTSHNLGLVEPPGASNVSADSRIGSYANSNPWDLDDLDNFNRAGDRESRASISPIDNDQLVHPFDPRMSTFKIRQSAVSDLEFNDVNEPSRESGFEVQHNRDTSTGTQQDRDALDSELAARANAIQENIKNKLEREIQSRGISPARSANSSFRGFSMLKSKPSRESVGASGVPEIPSNAPAKALRVLGSNTADKKPSISDLKSQYESGGGSLDRGRTLDGSTSTPQLPNIEPHTLQPGELDPTRALQHSRSRGNSDTEPFPSTSRSPPSSTEARSRANSAANSGRSRSRTGPYRDDLEKAMAEGTGTSAAAVPELVTNGPRELTPRSTPDFNQNTFEPQRERSASRGGMTNYFDAKSLHPITTGSRERLSPGVPSPALTPNSHSPMLSSAPLSPAGSFAQTMTPPLSGASTPLQAAFTPPPPIPFHSNNRPAGVLRKKTISKGDISEPTLISLTSNIDLIDLPEGASLKNGMDEPPPVPPLNPARRATKRILGGLRKESSDSTGSRSSRSRTPEAHSRKTPEADLPFDLVQMSHNRSETLSPQKSTAKRGGFDERSDMKPGSAGNLDRTSPPVTASMDGGMF